MKRYPQFYLADLAETQLGIRESSKNQGPGIAKFWVATDYAQGFANREPYCAAFVCWMIMQAMTDGAALGLTQKTRPKNAAVANWLPWARRADTGALVFTDAAKARRGDIVVFDPKVFSHIGIVTGPMEDGFFPTVEGNTDASGGREGDGVYERSRRPGLVKAFIRLAWKAEAVA